MESKRLDSNQLQRCWLKNPKTDKEHHWVYFGAETVFQPRFPLIKSNSPALLKGALFVYQNDSGTSPFRHLYSGDTSINFGHGKLNVPVVFILVTSNKGTSQFMGTPFFVPRVSPEWRFHCIIVNCFKLDMARLKKLDQLSKF